MGVESKTVRHGARDLLRHQVICEQCGWTSHRYDRRSTAELIFAEHKRQTCAEVMAATT